jgi:uroporphyrinogen-III decarboxylase
MNFDPHKGWRRVQLLDRKQISAYVQIVMTSKERLRRAMAGLTPDRVPVMCQMSIGHMLLQTGASPSAFWNSAEVYARGLAELRRAYDFDGILISLHGHDPDWERNIAGFRREENSEVVTWKNGDRTVFPGDDLPLNYSARERRAETVAAFDPESIPESIDFIPVSQGLDFRLDPDHRFDVVDALVAREGAAYSIHGEVTSPFDYYLNLFGFSEGFIGLLDNAGKARAILDRHTAALEKLTAELAARGVDAIKVSSPYAGAKFISPGFYREFVLPFESRLAATARRAGVPAYIHTCGAIHDRLEMMVEAGFAGLECLDPPPLGNVELADAKRRLAGRAFIKGNVDPVNVLLAGTPAQVRSDALDRLRTGMPGGGYILSTACSIAPRTKKRNVDILTRTAAEAGQY